AEHIILSNESSANESTVAGTDVNHQYSKSYAFERDFTDYVQNVIGLPVRYFSLLRPFNEMQIAKMFASLPQYHAVFKSCNAGSKQNIWCGRCPKCLFAYIILSPFIEPATMERIFGNNLLSDSDLQLYFDELIGKRPTKPFECVGTIDEVVAALQMTKRRFYKNTTSPTLMANFAESGPAPDLAAFSHDHNLPQTLANTLQKELEKVSGKHRQQMQV
ncbi:MAG: hypothetical protein J6W45_03360, partial [Bacteroidales bacterium]|nr:hypothetical protein [Bacteroidales bacterium]